MRVRLDFFADLLFEPPEKTPHVDFLGGARQFLDTASQLAGNREGDGATDPLVRVRANITEIFQRQVGPEAKADQRDFRVVSSPEDVIEHRLQMVEEHQTHTLPAGDALDNVARLHGLADAGALLAHLREVTVPVRARFDALLAEDGKTVAAVAAEGGGTRVSQEATERVASWTDGQFPALRSQAALAAFAYADPQRAGATLAQGPA